MMRDDFCAFIMTHGRPDRVKTYDTMLKAGYTGKVYIVIDDEDKTEPEYRKRYGDKVLQFSKSEIANTFDEGDNFDDRRAIIYARNACWDLARQVGCRYFIQLDDDYTAFEIRYRSDGSGCYIRIAKSIDDILSVMLDYYLSINCAAIAMAQGGDYIGGEAGQRRALRRKAMNTFICSVDRPFQFIGRINEDVNTYTSESRKGILFFTVLQAKIVQLVTQSNSGGMTETYRDGGTYIKSFYSVMYCPSGVKVGQMGDPRSPHYRIHHKINWHRVAPKILRETHRKASAHG